MTASGLGPFKGRGVADLEAAGVVSAHTTTSSSRRSTERTSTTSQGLVERLKDSRTRASDKRAERREDASLARG